jgi:7-keto-8-aminopelargonate synthetase-like enzyme
VDEAHALGATGPGGRGLAEASGCGESVDVVIGTLGKALGVSGAFIASGGDVVELLINRARTFIYTTAPPPLLALASLAALEEVETNEVLRQRLRENAASFRSRIEGITGMPSTSIAKDHIIPVRVPGAERVMRACSGLLEQGIFCQGIRPPTVPPGACRLRFSISALHKEEHLVNAARALEEVLAAL